MIWLLVALAAIAGFFVGLLSVNAQKYYMDGYRDGRANTGPRSVGGIH